MNQKIQYRYHGQSSERSCVLPFFSVIKLREPQGLYPFFERFFSGPRGTRRKTSKFNPIQLEGGSKGLHADIGSLQDLIKTAQNLK
jgi:hypothetical protein